MRGDTRKISRPYKDKPWIVVKHAGFWASLMGVCDTIEIDTSHPEWIKQVLIPTIEKYKGYTLEELSKMSFDQ